MNASNNISNKFVFNHARRQITGTRCRRWRARKNRSVSVASSRTRLRAPAVVASHASDDDGRNLCSDTWKTSYCVYGTRTQALVKQWSDVVHA